MVWSQASCGGVWVDDPDGHARVGAVPVWEASGLVTWAWVLAVALVLAGARPVLLGLLLWLDRRDHR